MSPSLRKKISQKRLLHISELPVHKQQEEIKEDVAEQHLSSDDDMMFKKANESVKGSFIKMAEKVQQSRQSLTAKHKM